MDNYISSKILHTVPEELYKSWLENLELLELPTSPENDKTNFLSFINPFLYLAKLFRRDSYLSNEQIKHYPYKCLGRVVGGNRNQGKSSSGAWIAPGVVLTAGHSIYNFENKRFRKNVGFIPAYPKNGDTIKGVCSYVPCEWANNGIYAFDIGIIKTEEADRITESLGVLIEKNKKIDNWTTYGSPSITENPYSDFGTEADVPVCSKTAVPTKYKFSAASAIIKSDGLSGGPWIPNVDTDDDADNYLIPFDGNSGSTRKVEYVNATHSFKCPNTSTTMCSPFFGLGIYKFFKAVKDDLNKECPDNNNIYDNCEE